MPLTHVNKIDMALRVYFLLQNKRFYFPNKSLILRNSTLASSNWPISLNTAPRFSWISGLFGWRLTSSRHFSCRDCGILSVASADLLRLHNAESRFFVKICILRIKCNGFAIFLICLCVASLFRVVKKQLGQSKSPGLFERYLAFLASSFSSSRSLSLRSSISSSRSRCRCPSRSSSFLPPHYNLS